MSRISSSRGCRTLPELLILMLIRPIKIPKLRPSAAEDNLAEADAGDDEIDNTDREHRYERLP